MNLKYENVPDMISGKDLDYLTDIFNWNYNSYKCTVDHENITTAEDVSMLLDKAGNMFYDNMQDILDILERGGCDE